MLVLVSDDRLCFQNTGFKSMVTITVNNKWSFERLAREIRDAPAIKTFTRHIKEEWVMHFKMSGSDYMNSFLCELPNQKVYMFGLKIKLNIFRSIYTVYPKLQNIPTKRQRS